MDIKSLNYQYLSRRFVIMPFFLALCLCFVVYLVSDIHSTIQEQVSRVHDINHLLTQTATSQNKDLIATQVKYLSDSNPQIESINFFPATSHQEQMNNKKLDVLTMFFGKYYGLSQAVTLQLPHASPNTNETTVNQLVGYVNTTLNLNTIRHQWFKRNLPMFITMAVASMLTLLIMLTLLKKVTERLSMLEKLSQKVLDDQVIEQKDYEQPNDKQAVWLYEKALYHLLDKQKTQTHQLVQLNSEIGLLKDESFKHIEQYSTFQSDLTHEFKLSLNRIDAGIKLLKNQYISSEQQGAVDIIETGVDDLNSKLNQLIQLNRIEKGQTVVELHQFNPHHLLTNIVEKFQIIAREKQLNLGLKLYHADYVLEGDTQKIDTILSSLVENALKFTEHGSVTVISQLQHLEKSIRWTISVEDTGIGIDKQNFANIFKPFFQVNPNISRILKNTTVGLFLVKKLVHLLNGDIEVTSTPQQGSKFTLHLLLKDWHSQKEQDLLKDKSFAVWYKDDRIFSQAQRLINAGAKIQGFHDSRLLLDYLTNNSVDMLIIMYKIPKEEVMRLVTTLREKQTDFRTLITYYYLPKHLQAVYAESLKAVGVDYLEDASLENMALDDYINRLIQYLA
ncbi:sensor histidine kinase [Faucicola boevrei]|uniref:sensor histidine kinase n=1 Tax=Faucicola boevrei TaxID=346665 RepID=UPI000360649E|nr:HAMP domain-containing sensor histidine kinase [Moraxella boevrei]